MSHVAGRHKPSINQQEAVHAKHVITSVIEGLNKGNYLYKVNDWTEGNVFWEHALFEKHERTKAIDEAIERYRPRILQGMHNYLDLCHGTHSASEAFLEFPKLLKAVKMSKSERGQLKPRALKLFPKLLTGQFPAYAADWALAFDVTKEEAAKFRPDLYTALSKILCQTDDSGEKELINAFQLSKSDLQPLKRLAVLKIRSLIKAETNSGHNVKHAADLADMFLTGKEAALFKSPIKRLLRNLLDDYNTKRLVETFHLSDMDILRLVRTGSEK